MLLRLIARLASYHLLPRLNARLVLGGFFSNWLRARLGSYHLLLRLNAKLDVEDLLLNAFLDA